VQTEPPSAGQSDLKASNEAANQDNKRCLVTLEKIRGSFKTGAVIFMVTKKSMEAITAALGGDASPG